MTFIRRHGGAPSPIDAVAAVTQRLAVLLTAGVSPVSAWSYLLPVASHETTDAAALPARASLFAHTARPSLFEPRSRRRPVGRPSRRRLFDRLAPPPRRPERPDPRAGPYRTASATAPARPTDAIVRAAAEAAGETPTDAIVRAAAEAGAAGESIADAISAAAHDLPETQRQAWFALAAAWSVATDAGAPLAASLRELAASFRQLGQLERDVAVALAGPAATARIVLALPAVGLAFGALMGFDTLRALFATRPGLLCLAVGVGLIAAGARWNARLLRRAQATDAAPGLALDLTAVGMAGGASVARARELVEAALDRYRLPSGDAGGAITAVLDLAARAGVPAAELLRSEAEQVRRDARSEAQRRAETLAVTLMLPLGLCVLPAFMLVGVAPLLLGVLASTFGAL